ncbi:hypothetical protein A3A75_01975 [Candidatus Woesebacteria bacterium RIFCSPLOWO2_01_FULL_39_10]|uniref:Uncharacterized protein n=1 Tax=Candidatus Woesebacteria bacterium RIFCSPLOWO2_01_FULL_39_10 TaxID=1802516 RepID=A0A1F8BAC9_9BACT|nr:MAG: hypothetical protein A3A75_01975 [Candidatus Woesebacteria bacterium RIFCSPLOWO2_01_FULL_39_10]
MSEDQPYDISNPLKLTPVDLERIGSPPKRDYSNLWNLPAKVEELGFRLSTSSTYQPDMKGASSITEGRVFRLPRFVLEFRDSKLEDVESLLPFSIPREHLPRHSFFRSVRFSSLIEKGGGIKPSETTSPPDLSEVSDARVTYLHGKTLSENYGAIAAGSADDSEQKVDEVFSYLYHLWGGRTRLPIATFPQETFSTPDGKLTREEAIAKGYFKDPKVETVVSLWAMRCPWTIDDVVGIFGNPDTMSTKAKSKYFSGMIHPGVEFFKTENHPSAKVTETAISFAQELVSYAKNDEDDRWSELAEKYGDINPDNLSQFYSD